LGLFDDVLAAGFRSKSSFGGLGYEAVWAQLKPWLANISTTGALKWLPRAAMQMPCSIPEYESGVPVGPCSHFALENCLCCGQPVCLTHAFVDSRGDAVCYLCVVQARGAGAGQAGASRQAYQPPPPPPPPPPSAEQQAWWARGILGVQEGVTWDAIKKQHRALSAQFHPDRPAGNEARFKDVQKAFEILRKTYGEK